MTTPNTRERILDSAEVLFAERGIDATSLRTLTRHAGVNLAAVHYHFGSKCGLLDAVVERLVDPINRERMARADELEAAGAPDAAALLSAWFAPVIDRTLELDQSERAHTLARLIARIEAQPRDEVLRLAHRHFGEIERRYVDALTRSLPELDRVVVAERFRLANALLIALFSGPPDVAADEPPRPTAARAREALAFAIAGLCSAATTEPGITQAHPIPATVTQSRTVQAQTR